MCMCMYVCVCVCMYVCMCVCVDVCMYVCVDVCMYVYMYNVCMITDLISIANYYGPFLRLWTVTNDMDIY